MSIGILNSSLVHPCEVFAGAVEQRATALICVHNHPSVIQTLRGVKPIVRRLVEAGELIGIPVLYHVIIGQDNYTSFANMGLL